MQKLTIIIVTVFLLSSCESLRQDYTDNKGSHGFWVPTDFNLRNLPQGDDSYSQGFRDGCNTAHGIIGSGYLRTHSFAYDINRGLEDKEYYRGYRIAYNYCTYYLDWDPL